MAASSLRERYQLPVGGLLAAFHFSLPHTQTTGCGTLGAKKGGVSVQSSPVMSAEQMSSNLRTHHPREMKRAGRMARILKTGHQVHHASGEKNKELSHYPKVTELVSTIKQNKAPSSRTRDTMWRRDQVRREMRWQKMGLGVQFRVQHLGALVYLRPL